MKQLITLWSLKHRCMCIFCQETIQRKADLLLAFDLNGLHVRTQAGFHEEAFFFRVLLWQEKLPAS